MSLALHKGHEELKQQGKTRELEFKTGPYTVVVEKSTCN